MIDLIVAAARAFLSRPPVEVVRDVVDVLLVAFLVYRVLVLLKGTRAMQMAIGLALVFLAYQAAQRIGLLTLWTLLDTLLTYVVLLVVVIFQADIRRALMRVGRQPLFRSARMAARESRVIDETTKAAKALAQRRIGALVVFERSASLVEFIEPGVELDAEVSRELLTSIFIPSFENPMHDGAVVIRDGRVWMAGAFLPLSTSAGLDRALGTRHRAALGISEETDAVVVVVSEERGAMTVCFGGNLVRDLDAKSLERVLRGLLEPRRRRRRRAERRSTVPPTASPRPDRDGTGLGGRDGDLDRTLPDASTGRLAARDHGVSLPPEPVDVRVAAADPSEGPVVSAPPEGEDDPVADPEAGGPVASREATPT